MKPISNNPSVESKELRYNFHAAPESDMIFDRFGRFFRLGVVPGGILIGSITDPNMIVARDALPRTCGVGLAWSQILPLDRIRRKIVIALYDNGLIGFGNDRIFPGRFHEILSFDYEQPNSIRSETSRTRKNNEPDTNCASSDESILQP